MQTLETMLQSCDASLLLESANGIESEKSSSRSFGMRNFKYINTIKDALESECPMTVSCADIVALSARDGAVLVCIYIYIYIHSISPLSYIELITYLHTYVS